MLGMEYWLALLMGLISLAALRPNPAAPLPALLPILLGQTLLVGSIFFIAVRFGQGGWRWAGVSKSQTPATDSAPVGDRTPDECWKLGLFYFNRNDPAVFVEKRFGIGWTLNLANPRSLLVAGALLVFILAILVQIASVKVGHGG
jgi:uncharacterized membrane protein